MSVFYRIRSQRALDFELVNFSFLVLNGSVGTLALKNQTHCAFGRIECGFRGCIPFRYPSQGESRSLCWFISTVSFHCCNEVVCEDLLIHVLSWFVWKWRIEIYRPQISRKTRRMWTSDDQVVLISVSLMLESVAPYHHTTATCSFLSFETFRGRILHYRIENNLQLSQ